MLRNTHYEGKRHTWDVYKLWELAKDLPVEEVDVEELSVVSRNCWFRQDDEPTVKAISEHCAKALKSDLSYPIILNADGTVMDGAHRVLKCLLQGQRTIRVVRFSTMPPAESVCEVEQTQKGDEP